MPLDATFNANEFEPRQSGGKHAIGNKWQGVVSSTSISPTKDKTGGMFIVELSSAGGTVALRYNLWNESEQARNIAKQQLSALCHATGVFHLDFKNDGAALRGAKVLYDVNFQSGQEPSAENPAGGYVEVKKVYDLNGNDTWNAGGNSGGNNNVSSGFNQSQQQPQQNQQQPQQNNQPNVQSGWNNGGQQNQNQFGNQTNNSGGGWSGGGENPPWK